MCSLFDSCLCIGNGRCKLCSCARRGRLCENYTPGAHDRCVNRTPSLSFSSSCPPVLDAHVTSRTLMKGLLSGASPPAKPVGRFRKNTTLVREKPANNNNNNDQTLAAGETYEHWLCTEPVAADSCLTSFAVKMVSTYDNLDPGEIPIDPPADGSHLSFAIESLAPPVDADDAALDTVPAAPASNFGHQCHASSPFSASGLPRFEPIS